MKVPEFPKVRRELQLVYDDTTGIVTLLDPWEYVRPDLAFEPRIAELLTLLDGRTNVHELEHIARMMLDGELTTRQFHNFLAWLNEELVLDSPHFAQARAFLTADVITPVCAGSVYPENPDALCTFLSSILESSPTYIHSSRPFAALIPHIEFRVAAQHYGPGFNAIRSADFDLLVHIGTSHYGWQDRFLLTTKDFITPLGRIHTDRELVEALRKEVGIPLARNDLAYQPEHSLELHHVFIQHLFPEHKFTILPVLVTSFHDYVLQDKHPSHDPKFAAFCSALHRVVESSNRKVLVLISGDLAHIGRRFGDHWDAAPMLEQLSKEDHQLLATIARSSSTALFEQISSISDRWRICGFPPLMTFLETFTPAEGIVIDYGQWNDCSTHSAVSFGSVIWQDEL